METLFLIAGLCVASAANSFCALPPADQAPAQVPGNAQNAAFCGCSRAAVADTCVSTVPCCIAGILLTTLPPLFCAPTTSAKAVVSLGSGCCIAAGWNLGRAMTKCCCPQTQPQPARDEHELMVRN